MACPACGGRSRYRSSYPSYTPPYSSSGSSGGGGGGGSSGGGSGSRVRARWSRSGSTVTYTPQQVASLTPIRESIESLTKTDLRDYFLCHAWDDRQGIAKQLHDLLVARGVKVWFSEKDIGLGVPLLRAIDKGLANSKVGIVLVTPALLNRLPKEEGIASKELSALLAGNRLVPVVHGTTYKALQEVSPLLGSRTGLDTAEDSMATIVEKLADMAAPAELVAAAVPVAP